MKFDEFLGNLYFIIDELSPVRLDSITEQKPSNKRQSHGKISFSFTLIICPGTKFS